METRSVSRIWAPQQRISDDRKISENYWRQSMKTFAASIAIAASPQRVWATMTDFEHWPEWTSTVTSIEHLSQDKAAVGSQVRILQPKLRPAVWTISDWRPEAAFTWISRNPGVTVVAEHAIEPNPMGCTVRLSVQFTGTFGSLAGFFARSLTERYLSIEAAGLKQQCESSP
jgi:uncharacterized protein YndB with AHSA1/START domain